MTGGRGEDPALTVAVVGLGGAGQRHLRILRRLLGDTQRWIAVRRRRTTPLLAPTFEPLAGSPAETYGLDEVETLEQALDLTPDLVVVATPTSMHGDAAVAAIRAGVPVLVEKPLAATSADARQVLDEADRHGVACFVGFQRRFHPAWTATEQLVRSGALGAIRRIEGRARSDVRSWHPYEPLDQLYAVRADLGGGVVATECHELDQIVGLLGSPTSVQCRGEVVGPGEVELSATVVLEYPEGPSVSLDLSLEASSPSRGWSVEGDGGVVDWDELTGLLTVRCQDDADEVREVKDFANDDLVAAQDEYVLKNRGDHTGTRPDLLRSCVVSSTIDAAQRSLRSGDAERVES